MNNSSLVVGLLNTSAAIGDADEARRYRGFTLAWARYGYQGIIIEHDSVDAILLDAAAKGYRRCVILPYGYVPWERWQVHLDEPRDFFEATRLWMSAENILLGAELLRDDQHWYGMTLGCLCVDLVCYRQLGSPTFNLVAGKPLELPVPACETDANGIQVLRPTASRERVEPQLPGWNLLRAYLDAGIPVHGIPTRVRQHLLDLEPTKTECRQVFRRFFGDGIIDYPTETGTQSVGSEEMELGLPIGWSGMTPDQHCFLAPIAAQAVNSRRGVFLWNIEAYDDIEVPPPDFAEPVSTLYSVAAGFKPNRILQTHGLSSATRVVFFDYSRAALEVKQSLCEQWDGDDFPHFVRYLFRQFPHPETFYQLWHGVTPETVSATEIEQMWLRELQRWGGAESFKTHWDQYRQLRHEYVHCNIIADPTPLFATVRDEESAVIWWSNAFFTMFGNWFYTSEQRSLAYRHWLEQLGERAPRLLLIGSDHNNSNVNGVRAEQYMALYGQAKCDCLHPYQVSRTVLRM